MSDEVSKAVGVRAIKPQSTIFQKIVNKEIPATILHEDDKCLAFKDVNPVAPTHILVIPKTPLGGMSDVTPEHAEVLGHLMVTAAKVARDVGVDESGYRLVVNEGEDGAQSVRWLHIHLMGGRQMKWPPG